MNKRSSYTRSALLLTIVFLASAIISAQKEQQVAGKGLNAVNVKLARYGGMQFGGSGMSSFRTTNDKGEFNFGVVPAGSYHLTVSLPKEPAGPANPAATSAKEKHEMSKSIIQNIKAREGNPAAADLKECLITLKGGVGGTIRVGWNFETEKAFDPSPNATAKTGGKISLSEDKIDVRSDGHNPLSGTVVRSKSNITNN
jgi:hypothetical protein